jgi:membrane protein
LVVLGPVLFSTALTHAPWLEPLEATFTFWRYVIATLAIVVALVVAHKWLPAGRRRFREIAAGIIVTLVMWLVAGFLFGRYLADYAFTYRTYYAGLAGAMIALVFLYLTALIFMYGGELNSAIKRARHAAREPLG